MNDCDKDPNIKTLAGTKLNPEAVDLEELRILKNELEADKKKIGMNKLEIFNKFIKYQLE